MTTFNIKANIQSDIHKIWEIISEAEVYNTWRSDVSKIVVTDEKQFTVYSKDGYSTMYTVTAAEPCRRLEFDVENSHIRGHWTVIFEPKDRETEIDFTAHVEAKGLLLRPAGKNMFEKTYLKREQKQFISDLKKAIG